MDKNLVALFIFLVALNAVIGLGIAFGRYLDTQKQIACYEAAKTNTNITCKEEK